MLCIIVILIVFISIVLIYELYIFTGNIVIDTFIHSCISFWTEPQFHELCVLYLNPHS